MLRGDRTAEPDAAAVVTAPLHTRPLAGRTGASSRAGGGARPPLTITQLVEQHFGRPG